MPKISIILKWNTRMSTQVGWFSKLYTKTTNKHFKRLTKMENETFFFSFLITYTYRFSHLLAKLCREHFKSVLDLPGVFTTGKNNTELLYRWKILCCINYTWFFVWLHCGYWAHTELQQGAAHAHRQVWHSNTDGFYWHLWQTTISLLRSWAEFQPK